MVLPRPVRERGVLVVGVARAVALDERDLVRRREAVAVQGRQVARHPGRAGLHVVVVQPVHEEEPELNGEVVVRVAHVPAVAEEVPVPETLIKRNGRRAKSLPPFDIQKGLK